MGLAHVGVQVAFAAFTVSRLVRPGRGRRLPRGLRGFCRDLPLAGRAHG